MAVLNIANLFNDTYLTRSPKELIFTKDKHIITHGVDFLSDYTGKRGLVPNYPSGNHILGKTGWEPLTEDLTNILEEDGTVPSSYAVINYLNSTYKDAILAAETMVFKGTIRYDNTDNTFKYTLVGESEKTGFIPSGNIGDTYRITTYCPGTIAGTKVEPGDILICIQNHKDSALNNSNHWTVILTNITGSRNLIAGGETYTFYSNDTTAVTIYSPGGPGTAGLFLLSSGGNTPNWVNLNISKDNNGILQLTTSSTPTLVNISDWTLNLTFGTGLHGIANLVATTTYNGTTATTINLAKATTTSLGGIIASNVLSTSVTLTSADGAITNRYYGVQVDRDGKAFVNVPWTDSNNTWRNITIGGNSIGNKTLNFITVANGSIGIVANGNDLNPSTTDIFDIGFDIFWYNLDTDTYETN